MRVIYLLLQQDNEILPPGQTDPPVSGIPGSDFSETPARITHLTAKGSTPQEHHPPQRSLRQQSPGTQCPPCQSSSGSDTKDSFIESY